MLIRLIGMYAVGKRNYGKADDCISDDEQYKNVFTIFDDVVFEKKSYKQCQIRQHIHYSASIALRNVSETK